MSQSEALPQVPPEPAPLPSPDLYINHFGRLFFMVTLLLTGLLMIFNADDLAIELLKGGHNHWTLTDARELAMNLRFFGALIFLAGIAERIVMAIYMKPIR